MPQIEAAEELIVSLYFFFAQQLKRGSPRFVTRGELAADTALAACLLHLAPREGALERGLELAVLRGTLLRARTRAGGRQEEVYVVNSPASRKALEALVDKGIQVDEPLPATGPPNASGIFALYEQNIRPLTPLIAEQLAEAEKRYPADWVHDAFREAASLNKTNWRYIESILRRWETEGRRDEESGRDTQIEWLERRYREGKRRLEARDSP
ncbi:MAG TPA: DnaD domain protein [Dehalococcoidia bacterium]|jgi:DnaD/phage-associated family protein|nr:DnaD domain protein [Dehalococcoidia bacterium]